MKVSTRGYTQRRVEQLLVAPRSSPNRFKRNHWTKAFIPVEKPVAFTSSIIDCLCFKFIDESYNRFLRYVGYHRNPYVHAKWSAKSKYFPISLSLVITKFLFFPGVYWFFMLSVSSFRFILKPARARRLFPNSTEVRRVFRISIDTFAVPFKWLHLGKWKIFA